MAKILIIDDDELLCDAIADKLERQGHSIDMVHTLNQALKDACANSYDIILLDVKMPDGNGLQALPQLKNSPSSPEVIIITGMGDADGAELAVKSGAWCYLEKTSIIKEITLPLSRALQYRDEKNKLEKFPVALKREDIIGNSPQIAQCLDIVARAAVSDANVLISGETGTGKELFARAIHKNSDRADKNFVVVDCAALPEKLVESMLFGNVKGAFTGADTTKDGLVKQADGGTLFLDEVGELPIHLQKSFLRVIQERCYRPVGGLREEFSNFRLVAATNRNLEKSVQDGNFRSDLLFRLKVIAINLPPLRDRLEDITELAHSYIMKLCKGYGAEIKGIDSDFIEALTAYDWPGNVRELHHTLENVYSEAHQTPTLFTKHLPEHIRIQKARNGIRPKQHPDITDQTGVNSPLPCLREAKEEFEKKYLKELLSRSAGNISAASRTAGLSRTHLYHLLSKHGLT